MPDWTDDAIIEEAKKWRWTPDGTQRHTYDRFDLMAYPSTWKENVVEVQDGQEPDQLMIDEAITAARALGLSSLKWHVRVKEPASELEQWLERRGFTVTETTELLAWELGVGDRPSLPSITPLSGISVSLVDSLDKFRAAERVGCQVFQNR